jgi:large subunit ribosomal protein L9
MNQQTKKQILLLDDVESLGRSGDIVAAKRGYIRNFLVPKKKAVIADKHTLKLQAALKEERAKRAVEDKKGAEELAARLVGVTIKKIVKVDPEGNMYGSVTTHDIAKMMQDKGYDIERRFIQLMHPIRALGSHTIVLKLKESVPSSFVLEIEPEGGILAVKP